MRSSAPNKTSSRTELGNGPASDTPAAQRPPLILTYHEVVPAEATYLYSVALSQLHEHLQLLAQLRIANDAATVASCVTFDDGHVSNYDYALPLLQRYAVPAIFFVTVGWTQQARDFMTWSQLRKLVAQGHEVQSHGWSHRFLTRCSERELRDELDRSRQVLQDRLGVCVEALSAPGGRWNHRVLRAAALAGYRRFYSSDPWMKPIEQNGICVFGRLMVRRDMDARQLRRLGSLRGTALLRQQAQYRLKEGIKTVLGDAIYQRLWRLAARKNGRSADALITEPSRGHR